jgi:excisionase family DNA binding protein
MSAERLTAADVLDVREVAEILHVPKSTVADWARRGLLPSVKIGRRRLYVRAKIEALLLADAMQDRS